MVAVKSRAKSMNRFRRPDTGCGRPVGCWGGASDASPERLFHVCVRRPCFCERTLHRWPLTTVLPLDSFHVLVGKTEVMADFMDQDVADDVEQVFP